MSDDKSKSDQGIKAEESQTQEVASSSPSQVTASAAAGASRNVATQIRRIRQQVIDLNKGDQAAVISITLLTAAILIGPYMLRNLRKAEDEDFDDFFSMDDPIDELARLARNKWEALHGVDQDNKEKGEKNALEIMLSDVLQSKALQQAAQAFVIQTIESEPVKAALQRLLKELFTDLINDKETLAQFVKLLQFAIQNPDVKAAAQQLVLDIVEEPDVKDALIQMIQRLGNDPQVQSATQTLLQDSTHHVLNDPDVLDHSMEFATDVLGDDIVQRTAGEALRNTVGHAFRPATSVLLTAAGVGLMIFGLLAIGYARSSEQEAILFESAARSLQTNTANGLVRIVTWPGRMLYSLFGDIVGVLMMPVYAARNLVVGVSNAGYRFVFVDCWFRLCSVARQFHRELSASTIYALNFVWMGLRSAARSLITSTTNGLVSLINVPFQAVKNGTSLVWTLVVAPFDSLNRFSSWLSRSGYRFLVVDCWGRICALSRQFARELDASFNHARQLLQSGVHRQAQRLGTYLLQSLGAAWSAILSYVQETSKRMGEAIRSGIDQTKLAVATQSNRFVESWYHFFGLTSEYVQNLLLRLMRSIDELFNRSTTNSDS